MQKQKYLLALDASNKSLSLALFYGQEILGEKLLNINNQHSVNLLPALDSFKDELNIEYQDLQAIAVTVGPGSFTGIRIAVSTANTMAYALNIPVIGISSLAALSWPFSYSEKIILASFDARGKRVFAALFQNGQRLIPDQQFVDNELPSFLKQNFLSEDQFVLIGDGYQTVKELCDEHNISYIRSENRIEKTDYISASSVGHLALQIEKENSDISLDKYDGPVKPSYCVMSQAERNLLTDRQNN